MKISQDTVGFVAIGRNEGERFKRCLASLMREGDRIVYVDSGSTDGSVAHAERAGAAVVRLDTQIPFTAARARNAGFAELARRWPDTKTVMFIDGDCEITEGFVTAGLERLTGQSDIGIVTGKCRERDPDATVYNRLCEIEWNGPVGEIEACGGIFMTRADIFRSVGGFNEKIIAAEDDDFCIRVRALGERIVRIDHDMCLHDADMRHFGQWWRRMVRAGHAFAQLGDIHGDYFKAERRRAWGWGLLLPAIALVGAPVSGGWTLLLFGLYPLSFWRTRGNLIKDGQQPNHAMLGAAFLTLAKFPNLLGMIQYRLKKMTGNEIGIVEYK
ncbi:glycosyltransferase [Hyphococcus sp.]|uniref:glycosyltransferase n=1 Tax=Hyphococcus sp. TaxID=2038636 RepID=UPI003CCB74B4